MTSALRLGTRQSALAKVQAAWVSEQLKQHHPNLTIELVFITTTGDKKPSPHPSPESGEGGQRPGEGTRPPGGLKALFTKEIEEALLDKRIDLAVHSLKDMEADLPPGLVIGAIPMREDPRDVWISKNRVHLEDLPPYSKVATDAVRRKAQVRHARPDLELVPIRGNVDTRLKKLAEGNFDGMILALAGLKRLGREREATEILSTDFLLPAVGQGALGLEVRASDTSTLRLIAALDHLPSHQAARAERAFLKAMGGSCQTPLAAYATLSNGMLSITGLVSDMAGKQILRDHTKGPADQAESLGRALADKLLAAGGRQLLATAS